MNALIKLLSHCALFAFVAHLSHLFQYVTDLSHIYSVCNGLVPSFSDRVTVRGGPQALRAPPDQVILNELPINNSS